MSAADVKEDKTGSATTIVITDNKTTPMAVDKLIQDNKRWGQFVGSHKEETALFRLVVGAARDLDRLHKQRKVHRGVCAGNLMVTEDGKIYFTESPKMETKTTSTTIVRPDIYGRSDSKDVARLFLAPESLLEDEYTEKTDVWAFGVLVWQIMTKC